MASISDHTPILIRNELVHLRQVRRRFKFENAWLRELGLQEVVVQAWQGSGDQKLQRRLYVYSKHLKLWGSKSDVISVRCMEEVKVEYASLLLRKRAFGGKGLSISGW